MCLFAKNAFLEWKRIEKKREKEDPSEKKKKLCFCHFLKFFLPFFCQLEEQQQGE